MNERLSLTERGEIAFKLRAEAMKISDPEMFEIDHDPDFQPDAECSGVYAFEYFIDRCRLTYSPNDMEDAKLIIDNAIRLYRKDEKPLRPFCVARLAATLYIQEHHEAGHFIKATETLQIVLKRNKIHISDSLIEKFLREIHYEIITELALESFYKH